jgi:hypothetical protein
VIFPAPKPTKPVKPPKERKPRKPIAKSNPARKRERFVSDFDSPEYREMIVSLPCSLCGVVGFSDPAHIKSRGAGGKADVIAPLCRCRPAEGIEGCHRKFDTHNPEARSRESYLLGVARGLWLAWNAIT